MFGKIRNSLFFILLLGSTQTFSASFECNKAQTKTETAICQHQNLNDADVKMATTYQILGHLLPMGSRAAMQDHQVQWLKQRNRCAADVRCLGQSYMQQQQYLDKQLQRVYQQGPF